MFRAGSGKTVLVQVLKQRTTIISPTIRLNQVQISHSQGLRSEISSTLSWWEEETLLKKGLEVFYYKDYANMQKIWKIEKQNHPLFHHPQTLSY